MDTKQMPAVCSHGREQTLQRGTTGALAQGFLGEPGTQPTPTSTLQGFLPGPKHANTVICEPALSVTLLASGREESSNSVSRNPTFTWTLVILMFLKIQQVLQSYALGAVSCWLGHMNFTLLA